MVNSSEKFLIDSNTLMTASRSFYEKIKVGNIVLLDMVKAEIDKGQDELKQ